MVQLVNDGGLSVSHEVAVVLFANIPILALYL